MGKGTPLQKYDYQAKRWTAETSASSNSNITNGSSGTIFEDSRGNLWAMADGTPLQKYDYQAKRWTAETSASSNSKIANGSSGTIFEDSRGNLWAMADGTPLQKYDYQVKRWTAETSASSNSNITDGYDGTLFEDSRGNLWSKGWETPLQKYDYQLDRWTAETRLSNNSNITNGGGVTFFEDSRGNLWLMGLRTPLQKYDYQVERWTAETRASSNSNITNGGGGTIFEDSWGNLWSMGNLTPLQKYDYQVERWIVETRASSNSNITNGHDGTIFEDSRGNLWSMADGTKLQKLTPLEETNTNDQKVKDFEIEFKTKMSTDLKIAISIKGFNQYTSNLFTHLQYRKKAESNWKVVKKRTMILDIGEYEFKWVLGTEETLVNGQKLPQKITISIQPSDIAKVKTFLSELSSKDINSLVNPTKLVSLVAKDKILTKIKLASGYSDLTSAQKTLITTNLITKTNDPDGTLKVIINYGRESFVFLASGFLKVADYNNNIAKVKAFLYSLSSSNLNSLVNSNKLVGAVTKAEILEQIKAASGYSDLTEDQKKLIKENLISWTEDPAGTLKVTITFKGETYESSKDGFKLTLQAESNKFQDFTSTDTIKSYAATLKASSKDVLSTFKRIGGYQRPANLASDISITKVIVKNALNPLTQKVTFELTISRQGKEIKKDVAVTFKALKVIAKPNKKGLFGLSNGAIVGISLGSIFGIGIIGFLIFYLVRRNKK